MILLLLMLASQWTHQTQPGSNGAGAKTNEDELAASVVDPARMRPKPDVTWIPRRGALSSIPSPSETAPAMIVDPVAAANSRELINQLARLEPAKGGLSPQQIAGLAQNFQQLAAQGPSALPAIREFLERNQDLSFDFVAGGKLGGYGSLRTGLLDVLRQLGGPEAIEVSRSVLQTTADPTEIAILARNLEQAAPGQYREEALAAVRDSLDQAAKGDLGKRDVAALFQLLQTYGDNSVITDLQNRFPQWNYYSTMALAGLPNGEGIPALIKLAGDPVSGAGGKGIFAQQMLAQVAGQYPDAGAALLEQARANRISDRAWSRIATGLAGDQYQYGSPALDNSQPPPTTSGLKGYHIESGNQNFYSLPLAGDISPDEIARRLALVDQLLAAGPSPAANQALQEARQSLVKRAR